MIAWEGLERIVQSEKKDTFMCQSDFELASENSDESARVEQRTQVLRSRAVVLVLFQIDHCVSSAQSCALRSLADVQNSSDPDGLRVPLHTATF